MEHGFCSHWHCMRWYLGTYGKRLLQIGFLLSSEKMFSVCALISSILTDLVSLHLSRIGVHMCKDYLLFCAFSKTEVEDDTLRRSLISILDFPRCVLRPFFGSLGAHMCAHTQFEVVAFRTRTFGKLTFFQQFFNLFSSKFQTFFSNFSTFLWFRVF